MAYSFNVNQLPATGSTGMYSLIALLISAGWTDESDSDGSTYAPTGGQVTNGGAAPGGLGNPLAWVRLRCPAVNGNTREICIQRTSTSGSSGDPQWRITYSAAALFSGGSPSATQVPTATDEITILGSGTDSSPSFAAIFGANGSYRLHVCAGGSDTGYPFYMLGIATGGFTNITCQLIMDTVQSFDTGDADPTWWFQQNGGAGGSSWAGGYSSPLPSSGNGSAWMGATSSTSNWVAVVPLSYSHPFGNPIPATGSGGSNTGQGPFSGNDTVVPCLYFRSPGQPAPFGIKGWSRMIYWAGTYRADGDTMSVVTSMDRIWFGGGSLPWAGVVPLS
jgi:hypothetical protein